MNLVYVVVENISSILYTCSTSSSFRYMCISNLVSEVQRRNLTSQKNSLWTFSIISSVIQDWMKSSTLMLQMSQHKLSLKSMNPSKTLLKKVWHLQLLCFLSEHRVRWSLTSFLCFFYFVFLSFLTCVCLYSRSFLCPRSDKISHEWWQCSCQPWQALSTPGHEPTFSSLFYQFLTQHIPHRYNCCLYVAVTLSVSFVVVVVVVVAAVIVLFLVKNYNTLLLSPWCVSS